MDISQLLNSQTPFNQDKLNLLDTVVNTLFTTTNNNDVSIFINLLASNRQ